MGLLNRVNVERSAVVTLNQNKISKFSAQSLLVHDLWSIYLLWESPDFLL